MNFWRLQCFVALAEANHFGHAAERLFVSQPALSAQIRHLEDALGVTLILRQPQVGLTEAGERLYPEALKILQMVNDAVRLVSASDSLVEGTLRLLYTRSVSAEQTFDLIESFREQAPGVDIEAQTMWTSDSIERIRSGLADAAFVRLPLDDPGSLKLVVLGSDEQFAVLRQGHPLAARRSLDVDLLSTYPLIHWPRRDAPGNHDALLARFSQGRRIRMGPPQPDHSHRLAMVARGDGYALVHGSLTATLPESLLAVPIAPEAPRSDWGLVWDGAVSHDGARIAGALAEFLRRDTSL